MQPYKNPGLYLRLLLCLFFPFMLLSACSTTTPGPVPETDLSATLPDIAASYLSELTTNNKDSHKHLETLQSQWLFWRSGSKLERDNLDTHVSDLWQLDGKTLIQKKFFHEDQRGVEFQNDDLRILNIVPEWQNLALLFDPDLLGQLTMTASGWHDKVPYRRYTGTINGAYWVIELRTDLMLPLLIEHTTPLQHETIKLIEAYPLDKAPWQQKSTDDYHIIDFADLGDMEEDPFVKKVEAMLGNQHHH